MVVHIPPKMISYIYFFQIIFLLKFYLFLSVLGLHRCTQAFSSCSEQGLLLVALHRLLTVVASVVTKHML